MTVEPALLRARPLTVAMFAEKLPVPSLLAIAFEVLRDVAAFARLAPEATSAA